MVSLENSTPQNKITPQRKYELQQTFNDLLLEILDHLNIKCEHCQNLIKSIRDQRYNNLKECAQCGKAFPMSELITDNKFSDFQYCKRCINYV